MPLSDRNERLSYLARQLIADWEKAPGPPTMALPDGSRASGAQVDAVNITWGWTARIVRTGEAALLLSDHAFHVEASPLLRSMLEHAIALRWVVDKRGSAAQALLRDRANGYSRFQAAQHSGWRLEGEAAERLERAIAVETDDDTRIEDRHLATLHRARTYGLMNLYQAWLIETWSTHATFVSAEPYFDVDDAARGRLHRVPEWEVNSVPGGVAITLHSALACYESMVPEAFSGRLETRQNEFEQIMSP
ncbi:DUF5677 domain-containing protein [Ornithinimicrobium tianjinense]|uniref:Uncharacterized protein n=1 Tax=Ornithinimicrobium tianjinense TaxID=1195761 RepID=A0A917BJM6_9MICO|nr:DUF5677 domain-containing protein [Ornithinimicrobium tianjinense]GGF43875.1 hypothetical protein GCM10011366_09540 [Ornithinimicrobium tianjinense]